MYDTFKIPIKIVLDYSHMWQEFIYNVRATALNMNQNAEGVVPKRTILCSVINNTSGVCWYILPFKLTYNGIVHIAAKYNT